MNVVLTLPTMVYLFGTISQARFTLPCGGFQQTKVHSSAIQNPNLRDADPCRQRESESGSCALKIQLFPASGKVESAQAVKKGLVESELSTPGCHHVFRD